MTTLETELISEEPRELPAVPLPPNASITNRPAFPDAEAIIAEVRAADLLHTRMAEGYREMAAELSEWAETSFTAQAETLPKE